MFNSVNLLKKNCVENIINIALDFSRLIISQSKIVTSVLLGFLNKLHPLATKRNEISQCINYDCVSTFVGTAGSNFLSAQKRNG